MSYTLDLKIKKHPPIQYMYHYHLLLRIRKLSIRMRKTSGEADRDLADLKKNQNQYIFKCLYADLNF